MTLEQVLELARLARRSPHARRVLHDALLERYGEAYEEILDEAARFAAGAKKAVVVMLVPAQLAEAEAAWRSQQQASAFLAREWEKPEPKPEEIPAHHLRNWAAIRLYSLADLARERNRSQATEQQVVTVRPRRRG